MQNMYDILNKFNSVANGAVLTEGAIDPNKHPQTLDYQEGGPLKDEDRKRERKLRATDHKTLDRLERQAIEKAKKVDEAPNEGNEFSGQLAKAKASGAKQFKVGDKTYPVKESKPDFLDLDKDGNKKEPMKKAAKDKKKKSMDESMQLLDVIGSKQRQARVYRDREYNEYHVRFVAEGQEVADRKFTDSKQSAIHLAQSWIKEALDINLLKALQKDAKPGIKDPESERNIHKKYGYRSDRDDDGGDDDDYDEHGNFRGKKKAAHVVPGEKRGRGRPKGSGGGKRLGAKATGRSKLARGSAIKENDLEEDYDRDEYDEEGEMAKSFLRTIEDASQELQDVLGDNENLPEWVQKKITLAYDYLDTARDYMQANPDEDDSVDMDDEEMSLPEDADGEFTQADYDKIARKKRHLMILNRNLEPEDAEEMAAHKLGYDYDKVLAWVNADHDEVKEGSTGDYSAKKARAGKDIGKPGKAFAKIAKSAGERYGSKERGEKVAGAVLSKLRAKESAGEELEEKAVSKAQRKAAGIAYAAKKGDIPKSELRGASKEMAKMKGGELKKFAKTKEKGLPQKKTEEVEETTTSGSVATAPSEGGKKSNSGIQFGKGIYEAQLAESFDRHLNSVLTEGMSVNLSMDERGGKNLTINATEEDADRLAQLLQLAGMQDSGDESNTCASCGGIHEGSCGMERVEEDLANSPDVAYADTDTMVNKLAGGLNGPKLQSNPNNMADNPLAMQDLGKGPYRQLNLGAMGESHQSDSNMIVDLYKRIS